MREIRVAVSDPRTFHAALVAACREIEEANPGCHAGQADIETDAQGHVVACTVLAVPAREYDEGGYDHPTTDQSSTTFGGAE